MTRKAEYLPVGEPAWIDFDPAGQRAARNAIASLALPGAIDELGIGVFRETLSDLLFPGMTVTMTRAVYLAVLPRFMYQTEAGLWWDFQKDGTLDLPALYHKKMQALQKEFCVKNKDFEGIIGNSKEGDVQREAWSIYWRALLLWHLIPPVSCGGKNADTLVLYVRQVCERIRDCREIRDVKARWEGYWNEFKEDRQMDHIDLLNSEKEFLLSRFRCGGSLLSVLAGEETLRATAFSKLAVPGNFVRDSVFQEACFFNCFMQTAFAGYNLLLNASDQNTALFEQKLQNLKEHYSLPDSQELLQRVFDRVSQPRYAERKRLLNLWLEACYDFKISDLLLLVREELLCKQENKAHTRVFKNEKTLSYERIKELLPPDEKRKWVGMKELDYRCYQTTRLLEHLLTGTYRGGRST